MKKTTILLMIALLFSAKVNAQKDPSPIKDGFDYLTMMGFDSGMVQTGKVGIKSYITQGNMLMNFGWDTTYKYWSGNWALSYMHYNKVEESNMDKHLFSAITGTGARNSEKIFAIGQNNAKLTSLNAKMLGVMSMEITNSTYAYNSMKFGDAFAKTFKAADKDSLILVISTFMKGQKMESKRVVLADFRYLDTTKNFLLDTWQKVNFIQSNDSVTFEMVSSDNGTWGMNTPAFFAMDNLEVLYAAGVEKTQVTRLNAFPNPVKNILNFSTNATLKNIDIFNFEGQLVRKNSFEYGTKSIDVSDLNSGIYFGLLTDALGQKFSVKFIKE